MPRISVSAAVPGLPDEPRLSRRSLLAALPASGALAALPSVTSAAEGDPVVSIYRNWLAARHEWLELAELPGNEDFDDPRSLNAHARELAAEDQMLAAAPSSLEGVAALVALAWSYIEPGSTDPDVYAVNAQSREFRALMAIWMACTGKEGYPET